MQPTMYDTLLLLPLFQGLCKEDLTNILEKVKLQFIKYKKGDYLAKQEETCHHLIFIIQGEVCSESTDKNHNYTLYETFKGPLVIEPYSLFGMYPYYTTSYYAETEVSALIISKSYILSELNNYEIFRLNYLNMLCNRSQTMYRKLWNAHIGDTQDKIINFLQLRCLRPAGKKKLCVRMEDLAELIDDTRINVSKVLNELQEQELISLSRKEILIPQLEKIIQHQYKK